MRVAVDVQEGLGGAVDRAHGVVGAAGAGRPGVQGLLVADLHQRLGDVVDVLDIHPAGHIGHAARCRRRRTAGPTGAWRPGVASSWRPRPVAADVGGVGEHAADAAGVAVGAAWARGVQLAPGTPARPRGS